MIGTQVSHYRVEEKPLLANLGAEPRFAELRALGEACHRRALRMLRENPLPEAAVP